MNDIFTQIDAFLEGQPWWVIALGAFLVALMFRRRRSEESGTSLHSGPMFRAAIGAQSDNVKIDPVSIDSIKSSEMTLDGEDAAELLALIRSGNKIGAIKLIREKKGLDLVNAKKVVEAMERIPSFKG